MQALIFPRNGGGAGTGMTWHPYYCLYKGLDFEDNNPCMDHTVGWPFVSRTLDPVLPAKKRAPTARNTVFYSEYAAAKVGGAAWGAAAWAPLAHPRRMLPRPPPCRAVASSRRAPAGDVCRELGHL